MPQPKYSPAHLLRKYFLSAFVVFSFAAYALHERNNNAEAGVLPPANNRNQIAVAPPTAAPLQPPTAAHAQPSITLNQPAPAQAAQVIQPTDIPQPTAVPTDVPPPTAIPPTDMPLPTPSGLYRDGTYTGDVANAFYGTVQVEAIIQGGKLEDVQFLDYPHDRRTSQRINNIAIPYLQQEAIQAQSANVDIISGATLTSQAFIESLNTALSSARNNL
jgi:uncharacterized protein with FMN-binding domain